MNAFSNWNMEVLRWIATLRTPALDSTFRVISMLGEELVVILLLCVLYWCINKYMAYTTAVTFFSTAILVQGLKITFRIPRPWLLDSNFKIVESARATAGGYSFPSGHTQGGAAIYGTVGFWVKNIVAKIVFFALLVLVGFSRLYLGVHTSLDVAVSLLVTLPVAYILARIFKTQADSCKRDAIVTAVVCALSVGISVLALLLSQRGLVEPHVVIDYCKQAGAAVGFVVGALIERRYVRFSTHTSKWWMQLLKFALGITGLLLIKEGLKVVIGGGLVADTTRYFLMVLWVSLVYPIIIKKLFSAKQGNTAVPE